MNPAAEIVRIAAENRARAERALAELDDLRRRHAEAERAMLERQPASADPVPEDDEDAYYNPESWLV